jgi:hypothetical protein
MWLASRHEIGRAKLRVSFGAAVSMQAIRDCPLRPAGASIHNGQGCGRICSRCVWCPILIERRSVSIGLLRMCDAALSRGNCKADQSDLDTSLLCPDQCLDGARTSREAVSIDEDLCLGAINRMCRKGGAVLLWRKAHCNRRPGWAHNRGAEPFWPKARDWLPLFCFRNDPGSVGPLCSGVTRNLLRDGWFADLPVEGSGFELSVPPGYLPQVAAMSRGLRGQSMPTSPPGPAGSR